MKAVEAKLLAFLNKSPQFVIPIYQRTYSWTEKECRQLWDDIVRCGSSDKIAVHFVGSIVYVESGLSQVTHQAPLLAPVETQHRRGDAAEDQELLPAESGRVRRASLQTTAVANRQSLAHRHRG